MADEIDAFETLAEADDKNFIMAAGCSPDSDE